jgi:CDGSH-type Zn-finger protein
MDKPVTITPRKDGPYIVKGPIKLVDPDGNEFALPAGEVVHLCRCGKSAKKPFCDGSHRATGFEADTKAK